MSANTYVVTGGAIKLTDFMDERKLTDDELTNLKRVQSWLKEEGIQYPEDLKGI